MAKKKKTKIEQPVGFLEAQVIEEQADEIKEEIKITAYVSIHIYRKRKVRFGG